MEADDEVRIWSEVRGEFLTPFQMRLYRQRAGIDGDEALRWWEHHVLSGEASAAIGAGWSLEDVVSAREASLSVSEAIEYARRTGLGPAEVLAWWHAGVFVEEAIEARRRGWWLDETLEQCTTVVERRQRQLADRLAAEKRRAAAGAASRRLGEELRARSDEEWARRQRRASSVLGVELRAGRRGEMFGFVISCSGSSFWLSRHRYESDEATETDSLEQCLADVADRTLSAGGLVFEAVCGAVSANELITASPSFAHACEPQVTVWMGWRPPIDLAEDFADDFPDIDGVDDIYDDDEDISYLVGDRTAMAAPLALVARRSLVEGVLSLVPALPDQWPEAVSHDDSIASVGRLFMSADDSGGWTAVGRFDDACEGIAAARRWRDLPQTS